ncbi:MAG: hypothetical protein MUF87_15565 [Anaerolineae bacterium]|jgi:hypothetical protein|nr:hypothetical protein [Anaerolineae bacterium]
MAYLNGQERAELLEKLRHMKFNRAKGYLNQIDPKARLLYLRNVQNVGEWLTAFELPSLGTRVTLIEDRESSPGPFGRLKTDYHLREVVVEAMPGNRA